MNAFKTVVLTFSFFFFFILQFKLQAQISGHDLLRNSYEVYNLMREPSTGLYRDKIKFNGSWANNGSTASFGAGMISLAVAAQAGYLSHNAAVDSALVTLRSLNGKNPQLIYLEKNQYGYIKHFPNVFTGASGSKYSTIDCSIMMAGILICKNYFVQIEPDLLSEDRKKALIDETNELWNSIEWSKIVRDSRDGNLGIVGSFPEEGGIKGDFNSYTEYLLVSWLAYHDFDGEDYDRAIRLWEDYYAELNIVGDDEFGIKANIYAGYPVLTNRKSTSVSPWLPSFIHQFNYYYIYPYRASKDYMKYHIYSYKADSAWWTNHFPNRNIYEWGHGAGGSSSGYQVNAIDRNEENIASPAIVAGYIPNGGATIDNLIDMYNDNIGVYSLPRYDANSPERKILWRYDIDDPALKTTSVEGVDFATMLYGLAESVIGFDFDNLTRRFGNIIPGRIEAEDYFDMDGVKGGKKVELIDNDNWMDYDVYVKNSGEYTITINASAETDTSIAQILSGTNILGEISLTNTGSLDIFAEKSVNLNLEEGNHTLRLFSKKGGFKVDYFDIVESGITSINPDINNGNSKQFAKVYPNPVVDRLNIQLLEPVGEVSYQIYTGSGMKVRSGRFLASATQLDVSKLERGGYLLVLNKGKQKNTIKLIK